MKYDEFFETLTRFPAFPYQKRLAENLFAGESVIIRAPTGAGKTWASVAPFLYSLQTGTPIADRLVYTLPLRSLASSLHAGVLKAMETMMPSVCSVGKDRAIRYGHPLLQPANWRSEGRPLFRIGPRVYNHRPGAL